MTEPALIATQLEQVDYVCIAADSLAIMRSELQTLKVDNHRLSLIMATAGHDLRNQLHVLMGTVEVLAQPRDLDRASALNQRAKSIILRVIDELEQLAYQAQTGHGTEGPHLQGFDIDALLEQMRDDWQAEADNKHLAFSVGLAGCRVQSNQRLLATIMNNVVGNAVRHTHRGGVRVEPTIEGQFLLLSVTDTGPGIAEAELRRSYDFSTRPGAGTKGTVLGLGFGLCIARKTAEVLRHPLQINTALNGGTCVRLHIPLAHS